MRPLEVKLGCSLAQVGTADVTMPGVSIWGGSSNSGCGDPATGPSARVNIQLLFIMHYSGTIHCAQVSAVPTHHAVWCLDNVRPRNRTPCDNFPKCLPYVLLIYCHSSFT